MMIKECFALAHIGCSHQQAHGPKFLQVALQEETGRQLNRPRVADLQHGLVSFDPIRHLLFQIPHRSDHYAIRQVLPKLKHFGQQRRSGWGRQVVYLAARLQSRGEKPIKAVKHGWRNAQSKSSGANRENQPRQLSPCMSACRGQATTSMNHG